MQVRWFLVENKNGGGISYCEHEFEKLKEHWDVEINPATGNYRISDTPKNHQMRNELRRIFEEIIEFNRIHNAQPHFTEEEKAKAKRARPKPTMTHHSAGVYLLKSPTSGLFKIGCTNNIGRRLANFWNLVPEDLEIFAFAPTKEYKPSERFLHAQYQSKRIKGEWFSLKDHDLVDLLERYDFILLNKAISQFLAESMPSRS